MADSLKDKVLVLGGADTKEEFPLSDYVRKNYQVETSADGILWDTEEPVFDNSTEAQAFADENAAKNLMTRVIVVEVTDVLKKAFWNLWNTKGFKKQIQAQGVFVTKRDGKWVVSETKSKATRAQILRDKGYGRSYAEREPSYSYFAGNCKFEY